MTYEETLNQAGWLFSDSCNCGGTLKRNYKNDQKPGFIVTIQPMRQNFMIKQENTILKIEPLTSLEQALGEI